MKIKILKDCIHAVSDVEARKFYQGEEVDLPWKLALELKGKGLADVGGWFYQERYQG